jgi:hypothetical protein
MWNDALPRNGITNWSYFTPAGTSAAFTNSWQSWMKPAGCSWVYIFGIGSGGAGGNGNNAVPCSGGGGGSGSVTRLLIPATFVPDILYVRPAGGNNDINSTAASRASYISIAPNNTAQNLILTVTAGSGGFNNTAGSGAAAATFGSGIWMNSGLFTSIAGQSGGAGVTTIDTAGGSVTFGASGLPVTGGGGGGRGSGAGGSVIGAGLLPTRSGGAGTTGGNGENGFRQGQNFAPGFKLFPLLFSGGAGGGGISTGTAGVGGRGSWGCGGGGGGMANSSVVVTASSFGGDALILIGAF